MSTATDTQSRWREDFPFWTLVVLLAAAFILGGSARDDVLSLPLLRPIASICLAIGLFGLTREEIARFRGLFIAAGALVLLIALHLVPLPPSVWTALPGRELAEEAARLGGIQQPWRPLTLVPWRGWNSLYSLVVPLAALILAVRCTPQQRERLPGIILILILLGIVVAVGQVAGGYSATVQLYRVNSENVPTGLFANRNHFAAMLCCGVTLLAFLVGRQRSEGRAGLLGRWLAGVAAASGFLLLLMTGSRAGLVLSLLALLLAPSVYSASPAQAGLLGRRTVMIALAALVTLIVIGLAIYFARAETIERMLSSTASEEARFDVWGPIVDLIRLYFPFGSGAGSFVEVYRAAEPHQSLDQTYLNHAHSDWLEWPLEMGLPGVLLIIAGVAAWAWRSVQLFRKSRERMEGVLLARAGAIILLLLGLASLVDYPARTPAVASLAAVAMVWIAAAFAGRRRIGEG